jgi:hypothetical protein
LEIWHYRFLTLFQFVFFVTALLFLEKKF